MEEKYNLSTIFVLDSMHDQRIDKIEANNNMLKMRFEHISHYEPFSEKAKEYYDKHVGHHSCDMVFLDLDSAYAEVTMKKGLSYEGRIYYMEEFIEYLDNKQYIIEIYNMFTGYQTVILQGTIIDKKKDYCEECMIRVFAKQLIYRWK